MSAIYQVGDWVKTIFSQRTGQIDSIESDGALRLTGIIGAINPDRVVKVEKPETVTDELPPGAATLGEALIQYSETEPYTWFGPSNGKPPYAILALQVNDQSRYKELYDLFTKWVGEDARKTVNTILEDQKKHNE